MTTHLMMGAALFPCPRRMGGRGVYGGNPIDLLHRWWMSFQRLCGASAPNLEGILVYTRLGIGVYTLI